MGKKNRPYDGPRMSQSEKTGYLRNLGKEKYGIDEYDSKYIDDEGNDTDADRDADILKAMNNDYDFRSSQQYGKDAGLDGFSKLDNGYADLNNAYNSHRAIVKHGYDEMDHKNVSSNQDYANITNDLFNRSRDKFAEGIQAKTADEQQAEATDEPVEMKDIVLSGQMQQAKERVQNWEKGSTNIYNPSSAQASQATGVAEDEDKFGLGKQIDIANSGGSAPDPDEFANIYKNDVSKGLSSKIYA